jgi:hypothetical protein
VQLLECGRTEDGQVLLVLQRCDEDLRVWRQRQDDECVRLEVVDLLRCVVFVPSSMVFWPVK